MPLKIVIDQIGNDLVSCRCCMNSIVLKTELPLERVFLEQLFKFFSEVDEVDTLLARNLPRSANIFLMQRNQLI